MARPLRIEYPGALYHVTTRGNAGKDTFFDDRDRALFLSVLTDVVEEYQWICHAYCLMTNHYHLLIETVSPTLSAGMRQLNGVFTQAMNRRHTTTGHLFQGRFKAILVQKDSHLLALCRYIVLNPVKAGISQSPDAWHWSSYRATAGLDSAPDVLSTDWVLSQFSPSRTRAHRLYREFVRSGLTTKESPWKDLKAGIVLGSPSFTEKIGDRMKKPSLEVPKRERHAARPHLAEIIPDPHNTTDNQLIRARDHGYSLQEIGDHLSLHYATISRRVKRGKEQRVGRKKIARNKT
ncbi:MAG: Transposase IS200 like protein [Syntrophorhabdus sp. PtaU1.Bin058]|nr:MAG: Transposase IS200 like protein [Syntrophorhabdus sp. PtaU1.Bin058]